MSKEMTPKEAFEKIKEDMAYQIQLREDCVAVPYFDIIETALEDYERIKQTKFIVIDKKISDDDLEKLKNQGMLVGSLEQCKIKPLFDEETQKKIKAFEIIKEKKVQVIWFGNYRTLQDYNYMVIEQFQLTKEEYDLLKEYLK